MLNPKRSQFVDEFFSNGNATRSYQKVFGTASYDSARAAASKLLTDAEVQARLRQLQDAMSSDKIATATELRERLSAVARGETYDEVYLPNGAIVHKRVCTRDQLKAAELLLKVQGAFVTKVEADISAAAVPIIIKDDM